MPTSWSRYCNWLCRVPALGLSLDVSRTGLDDTVAARLAPAMEQAFKEMEALEKGALANPDEKRMVGHYWLRAPVLAPTPEIRFAIEGGLRQVREFVAKVHKGEVCPAAATRFTRLLCIGIGGSALGPMLVADALGHLRSDAMQAHFLDNTDPDGMSRTLEILRGSLGETLCVVTSKSGGTPETRNGMLVVANAYRTAGLAFAKHAVAITMPESALDKQALAEGWLARFPMFDWIGGRTSVTSAVGLLPAALQGLDITALLDGAAVCDQATRLPDPRRNPAALLAMAWYQATGGKGLKDMVVLPYKDRLLLFSRYLQQLIMESLGKRLDLSGQRVDQGLAVYGNKGSTDQHAYVQQLRDGVDNFFVTFVRVLEDGGTRFEVEPGVTAGDYLDGFLLGTREALAENGRASLTLTIPRVDARSLGALIALFERAVGFYASLIQINAYHQPGVEAGKKAAGRVLTLQGKILAELKEAPATAEQLAERAGAAERVEDVFLVLEHLAANGRAKVAHTGTPEQMTFTRA